MRLSSVWTRTERGNDPADYRLREQRELSTEIASVRALNSRLLFWGPLRRARLSVAIAAWVAAWVLVVGLAAAIGRVPFQSISKESLFLATFTILGLACVHVAYEQFDYHRWSIARMIGSPADCHRIREVVRTIFAPWPQLWFSLVGLSWAAALAFLLLSRQQLAVAVPLWTWWMVAIGIFVGNGIYWAIVTPLFVRRVTRAASMVLDPLAPASTPGLRALSSMLGTYAIMNALGFTSMLIGFRAIAAPGNPWLAPILWFHLALGGAVVLYSLVFPQLTLAGVVSRHKAVLEVALITRMRACLREGTMDNRTLDEVRKMLDTVRSSPSTPIAAEVIWKYLTSALIPLTAFVMLNHQNVSSFLNDLVN